MAAYTKMAALHKRIKMWIVALHAIKCFTMPGIHAAFAISAYPCWRTLVAKTFAQYPDLVTALTSMAMDSQLTFRAGWQSVVPPAHMAAQLDKAEQAAAALARKQVGEYILSPDDHIQPSVVYDVAEAEDNCLETVAAGDRTVSDFILARTLFGDELEEVLTAAYCGELHGLLFDIRT
jgi:hypothetical protein